MSPVNKKIYKITILGKISSGFSFLYDIQTSSGWPTLFCLTTHIVITPAKTPIASGKLYSTKLSIQVNAVWRTLWANREK